MTEDRPSRATLPTLNWLRKHASPDEVQAVARALIDQRPPSPPPCDDDVPGLEVRPSVPELLRAATGVGYPVAEGVRRLGDLAFWKGKLLRWGTTKAGKPLRPIERVRGSGKQRRSPGLYLSTDPTTPCPLTATSLPRIAVSSAGAGGSGFSYDPLPGVEEARAELAALMAAAPPITLCATRVAKGAYFIGGLRKPKPGANAGTVGMWEAPPVPKGEVGEVLDEIASGGTLKSLGARLGFGPEYADRAGKRALLDAARVLVAANDNREKKIAA